MNPLEVCFWICAGCVLYAYAGYPLLLAGLAWLRKRRVRRVAGHAPSVSIVAAVHNEEARIGTRVDELAALIASAGVQGEVLVVSDGSTDGTAAVARAHGKDVCVRVIELPERGGKAAALSRGCAEAVHEILVFADARQTWAPRALATLLENFADPEVGGVSGELVVESSPGVMAGVGLYWRYEKWLRKKESQVHSTVGVTGAICAVRRHLFRPVPSGTLLDDVYWPLVVAMQGYRVVHDRHALAHDRLPERTRDEFRRKVRTLAGNFQLVARLPAALLPWRNPVWFQLLSHKLMRLLAPWALLGMLLTCALLSGPFYRACLAAQGWGYLLGVSGLWREVGQRVRPAAAAASFLVLNAAAWLAFWVWLLGRADRSWGRVVYASRPLDCSTSKSGVPV